MEPFIQDICKVFGYVDPLPPPLSKFYRPQRNYGRVLYSKQNERDYDDPYRRIRGLGIPARLLVNPEGCARGVHKKDQGVYQTQFLR